MDMSVQLHSPVALPQKVRPVRTEQEAT